MAAVGDGIDAPPGGWSFGGHTPAAFDEHVGRSVPFYAQGHDLILDLAEQLVPSGGRCYDFGCSTGTLTARLTERLASRGGEVIGIDREPEMIALALERHPQLDPARLHAARLEDCVLEPADLVVSYYTLQFVPPRHRARLVAAVRRALQPAGAFVLFEKVVAETGHEGDLAAAAYASWKRRQGYSDGEIAAKARSLLGVLQPQTAAENRAMLRRAGFGEPMQLFRWLSWEGLLVRPGS